MWYQRAKTISTTPRATFAVVRVLLGGAVLGAGGDEAGETLGEGEAPGGGELAVTTSISIFMPLVQWPAIPQMKYRFPAASRATRVLPVALFDTGLVALQVA